MTVTKTFKASGLHCSSCSMLITLTLEELDGVSAVACEHSTGKTVVMFDDDVISAAQIGTAIQGVGYEAELVG